MHSIRCIFPLIGEVSIDIKNKKLFNFTKRQLKNYVKTVSKIQNLNTSIIIKTSIKKQNSDILLGRLIVFKNNQFRSIQNSKVQTISYEYDFNKNLIIKVDLKKKSLFYLKKLLKSDYSITHGLFYQTILYPIFSLYSIKDNYSLVHGSLLKIKDNYIVLTGLDGVGKSSLSNELVIDGAEILADNFVLYNGNNFIGLNMPIRLDLDNKTEENIIYKDKTLKEILYKNYEKNAIQVKSIYFLSIGEYFSINDIDEKIAKQNWNLINNGANEILGANLFNMPFLYQNIFDKESKNSVMAFYHLSIPKGKIKEAKQEILCQLSI